MKRQKINDTHIDKPQFQGKQNAQSGCHLCHIVLTTVMFTSLFVLSQSMVENLRNMNFSAGRI